MPKRLEVLRSPSLESIEKKNREFALDVLLGLSKTEKSLSSRYFYDERGSELFQRITDLPEYYPTECERQVLLGSREHLSHVLGDTPFSLIELGSGDGRKTNILLEHFLAVNKQFSYVPIDISESALQGQIDELDKRFPELDVHGVVAEYNDGIEWTSQQSERRNFVLFLGSNLGNFHRGEARAFLRRLWNYLRQDDLLMIGFDLKKPIAAMQLAYNDSQGVTAEFNMNLLQRINRELGGNFQLDAFQHYSTYNVSSGAMESYLVSLERQRVYIEALQQEFTFLPFEPIHTEYSYKFLLSDIEELAASSGYVIETNLFEERRWFVDSLWRVEKKTSQEHEKTAKESR